MSKKSFTDSCHAIGNEAKQSSIHTSQQKLALTSHDITFAARRDLIILQL